MDLVIVCADLRSVTVFLSLRSSNLDYSGVSPSQPARYAWFHLINEIEYAGRWRRLNHQNIFHIFGFI